VLAGHRAVVGLADGIEVEEAVLALELLQNALLPAGWHARVRTRQSGPVQAVDDHRARARWRVFIGAGEIQSEDVRSCDGEDAGQLERGSLCGKRGIAELWLLTAHRRGMEELGTTGLGSEEVRESWHGPR
jgi:hypothetical protein